MVGRKKTKALLLMSGGLDSILAARLLMRQGINVIPICFKSYFFSCDAARKAAAALNCPLRVVDFSDRHLEVVKHPRYGRGKAINPCIDCRLLMLKRRGELWKKKALILLPPEKYLMSGRCRRTCGHLSLLNRKPGLEECF